MAHAPKKLEKVGQGAKCFNYKYTKFVSYDTNKK